MHHNFGGIYCVRYLYMPIRLIKNANPPRAHMILYRTPKGFFKKLRKAFTYDVYVWVCHGKTDASKANALTGSPLDNSAFVRKGIIFFCKKEKHNNLWASDRLLQRTSTDVTIVDITNMMTITCDRRLKSIDHVFDFTTTRGNVYDALSIQNTYSVTSKDDWTADGKNDMGEKMGEYIMDVCKKHDPKNYYSSDCEFGTTSSYKTTSNN